MKFPSPFILKSRDPGKELVLEDIDDLRRFSDSEISVWDEMLNRAVSQSSGAIQSSARQAIEFLNSFRQQVSALEGLFAQDEEAWQRQQTQQVIGQIDHMLSQFASGLPWLTSSSYLGIKVSALGKTHPIQAVALWMIENDSSSNMLGNVGQGVDVQALLRAIPYLGQRTITDTSGIPSIDSLRSDYQAKLSLLKEKFDETRHDLAQFFDRVNSSHADQNTIFSDMEVARAKRAKNAFDDIDAQWKKMQLTFNTQLALRAPATYWKGQSESSRHRLWASAAVFVVAGAISLSAFLRWGLPYLANPATGKGVILYVLPIIIPAFMVIWIMKILSRLMSSYLQRADDANERRVMVMTFLALMNRDGSGNALVNDQDRILILHALFRPSSVSPTDDAPPVHWFDLLTSRMQK